MQQTQSSGLLTVRFKPACSATEPSWKIKISLVASSDMMLSNMRILGGGGGGGPGPMARKFWFCFFNPQLILQRGSNGFLLLGKLYKPLQCMGIL